VFASVVSVPLVVKATSCVCVSNNSHFGYIVSYLLAMIGQRSHTAKLTIAIEAGFQSIPTMLLVLQLTCPQPESMLSFPFVVVYLFNCIGTTLIALVVVIIRDIRQWQSNEPLTMDIGPDVSPSIADTYSLSKATDPEKSKGLGLRTSSFVSLSDKF
jgi:hypothetical protein